MAHVIRFQSHDPGYREKVEEGVLAIELACKHLGYTKENTEKRCGSFEWARCFFSPPTLTVVMLHVILPWAFDKLPNTNQTSISGFEV